MEERMKDQAMTRYRVTVEQTSEYEGELEAKNAEEAMKIAEKMALDGKVWVWDEYEPAWRVTDVKNVTEAMAYRKSSATQHRKYRPWRSSLSALMSSSFSAASS